MLHISDIKKFLRCEKLYLYSKDDNAVFKPYLRLDESINDLLINFFDIDTYYEGIKNDPVDKFINNIDNYEWFFHPRFIDGELRINIPLMHKIGDIYDLYFINYGTQIKDIDLITYRISVKVLNKYNIKVNNIYLINFNENYVNDGVIDPKKLFIIVDEYKDRKLIDITLDNDLDYEDVINRMNNLNDDSEAKKCKWCRQNGLCQYYYKCFENEERIEDDSILTLVSSANKNKMYEAGIRKLKDVDVNLLEGNRVQYSQIMASINGGLFVDKYALKEFLSKLDVRPISFIDFEWDRYLVPPYKNMKPLDVLCFEFALYYIDENGHMENRTFVGTGDCRKEFIEGLIDALPSYGPILAYNAEGAEQLRLIELSEMYPEYKQKLDAINARFIDLATPFIEGLVYDTRMAGNYTLKKLVDICSEYSYSDLDIYDGMEAVFNWRDIDKNRALDENKIVEDLKQYCSLDAYGLFLVYKWLITLLIACK